MIYIASPFFNEFELETISRVEEILQERGLHIREKMAALPLPVEFGICLILLICVSLFSPMAAARGFIYAQF